jgi:hypothetical protein
MYIFLISPAMGGLLDGMRYAFKVSYVHQGFHYGRCSEYTQVKAIYVIRALGLVRGMDFGSQGTTILGRIARGVPLLVVFRELTESFLDCLSRIQFLISFHQWGPLLLDF